MTETRITVEVHEDWEATGDYDVEIDTDLDVRVESHLAGLAWVGVIALITGAALITVGALAFLLGYPDKWHALGYSLEASYDHVRLVVITISLGTVAIFTGASFFFYGRRTTGYGEPERVRMEAT